MAVANNTILQKMMLELQQAKQKQENQVEMLKHIENIRLLCDLFLPEEKAKATSVQSAEVSAAELKAMLGEEKTTGTTKQGFRKSIELDDEDGNGDSLFDF